MAERNDDFWLQDELKLSEFRRDWVTSVEKKSKKKGKKCKSEKDYSMGGELEERIERNVGNNVVLVGPLVDFYLKMIGNKIYQKLSRGNHTGLIEPPINIQVPWQIMRNIVSMATSYGASLKIVNKDKTKRKRYERVIVWIGASTADKVFNPSRFDGTNYLAKRKLKNESCEENGGKRRKVYDGEARVAFSDYTEMRFEYMHKDSSLHVHYYIQRYTKEGFVVDVSLQKLMNTDNFVNENIFDEI